MSRHEEPVSVAIGSGQYEDPILFLQDIAHRARTDPDGASPYFPGFTNWQTALFFGGGPIFGPVFTHYHAPIVEGGLPVGFQFVTIDQWLDFITASANYEPTLFELDYSRMMANMSTPYTNHLGDITVPVFDLGGAGGIAPYTEATLSHLGSTDITKLYVSTGAGDPSTPRSGPGTDRIPDPRSVRRPLPTDCPVSEGDAIPPRMIQSIT